MISFRASQLSRATAKLDSLCCPKRMLNQGRAARQTTVSTTRHRRREDWVAENKPVNLLVLGSKLPPSDEALVEGLSSLATIKARGNFDAEFQTLSEADWEELEVLFLTTFLDKGVEETVQKAKNLRWIHTFSAGVNQLANPTTINSNIPITNSKGVYSHSLAEYALFACNYFAKNLPKLQKRKAERQWDKFPVEELRGRTMGIIGLGDIGMSTARIAKAFKMNVIGVRRNPTLSESEKEIIDEVYGSDEYVKVIGLSDYVVVALPLTSATFEMINAEAINALQPHAVFINIGRGKTVDEPALIKALQERRFKGAALDVYYDEPLAPDSPFFDMDNVLMSFHNADVTSHSVSDSLNMFRQMLQDYIDGKELQNLVDIQAGY